MAWKNEWDDCCGNCKNHKKDQDSRSGDDWICMKEDSPSFGGWTAYEEEWEDFNPRGPPCPGALTCKAGSTLQELF